MSIYAVADYQEPLRTLILGKQHSDHIAILQLAEIMLERLPLGAVEFDCIVPIPLHWYRKAWRGFNQSEIIASAIARVYNKPVAHLLKRSRRTVFQSNLTAIERASNVRNAFVLSEKIASQYVGKKILLVDDLMTTGATLYEAGHVLLGLKPICISAAVACRVVSS
jgi:Predicted amidophosphoribosyltransferases